MKFDVFFFGFILEFIIFILLFKGKSKCFNSILVSYLFKYYRKGENIYRIRLVIINMYFEYIVEEKKSRK